MAESGERLTDNPSIMSHVSVGTNDLARAAAFYDAVLPAVGARRIMEHAGGIAWGKLFPEFWVQVPADGRAASVGNGTHVSFLAPSRAAVDAFYASALAHGAADEGAPGVRPHYSPCYYGCFVRDPDGHKIEAMVWDESAAEPG